MEILEKMGFMEVKLLDGFHNDVYIGKYDDNKVIIRVSKKQRRTYKEVLAEIKYLEVLRKTVKVIQPFVIDDQSVFEYADRVITLFKYIPGSKWNELDHTDEIIYNAGRNLALIHDGSVKSRLKIDRPDYKEHNDLKLFLKNYTEPRYLNEYNETIEAIEKIPRENNYFLIHGDYLFSNIIYGDEQTVIDFDDCEYGYYLYDIAVYMFYYLLGGNPLDIDVEQNRRRLQVFLKGYSEIRDISLETLEELNPFFRLRQLKLLGTLTEYLKNKPGEWQKRFIEGSLERIERNRSFIE